MMRPDYNLILNNLINEKINFN